MFSENPAREKSNSQKLVRLIWSSNSEKSVRKAEFSESNHQISSSNLHKKIWLKITVLIWWSDSENPTFSSQFLRIRSSNQLGRCLRIRSFSDLIFRKRFFLFYNFDNFISAFVILKKNFPTIKITLTYGFGWKQQW